MTYKIFLSKVTERKSSKQVKKSTESLEMKIKKIKVLLLKIIGPIKKEKKVQENFLLQILLDATKEVFKEKRKSKRLLLKLS